MEVNNTSMMWLCPILLVLTDHGGNASMFGHAWVPGAKTTGPIVLKSFVLNPLRNFKFQYTIYMYSVIYFTKVHSQIMGARQKWRTRSILFLDMFQRNLAHL
jgi:hypothetical protein